jgi:hypothetical protein
VGRPDASGGRSPDWLQRPRSPGCLSDCGSYAFGGGPSVQRSTPHSPARERQGYRRWCCLSKTTGDTIALVRGQSRCRQARGGAKRVVERVTRLAAATQPTSGRARATRFSTTAPQRARATATDRARREAGDAWLARVGRAGRRGWRQGRRWVRDRSRAGHPAGRRWRPPRAGQAFASERDADRHAIRRTALLRARVSGLLAS